MNIYERLQLIRGAGEVRHRSLVMPLGVPWTDGEAFLVVPKVVYMGTPVRDVVALAVDDTDLPWMLARAHKPWGWEETVLYNDLVLKQLTVHSGHRTSLQYHEVKQEALAVFDGDGYLEGGKVHTGVTHIAPRDIHRVTGYLHYYEASTNELEDVVRLEDDYGR